MRRLRGTTSQSPLIESHQFRNQRLFRLSFLYILRTGLGHFAACSGEAHKQTSQPAARPKNLRQADLGASRRAPAVRGGGDLAIFATSPPPSIIGGGPRRRPSHPSDVAAPARRRLPPGSDATPSARRPTPPTRARASDAPDAPPRRSELPPDGPKIAPGASGAAATRKRGGRRKGKGRRKRTDGRRGASGACKNTGTTVT